MPNVPNYAREMDAVLRRLDGSLELVRRFGYEDFKNRLS